MWLLLTGLALLTGDVLSQVNTVIDSETDLLALPSDQLIHSSAELLAMEDSSFGLEFSRGFHQYPEPLFAYSYTIGEESSVPSKEKQHPETLTSTNVKHSSTAELKMSELKPHKVIKPNPTQHVPEDKSHNEVDLGKLFSQFHTSDHADKHDGPGSEAVAETSLFVHKHPNVKTPQTDFFISKDMQEKESHFNPQQLIIQNEDNTSNQNFDHLPSTEELGITSALEVDYLPPSKYETITSQLSLDYLPPKESSPANKLNLDYLPSEKKVDQTNHQSFQYLPPTSEFNSIPDLMSDYLPPQKELSNTKTISLDYLPPEQINRQIFNQSIQTLPHNQFPHTEKSEKSTSQNYGLPTKDIAESNENMMTRVTSNLKPVILKVDHEDEPLIPLGIERRLSPPTVEFESMSRNYGVFTKGSSVSKNMMTQVTSKLKPVALKVNHKDEPLIPLGIKRPLSPPSIEFESTSHNYVLPTKDSSASSIQMTQVTSNLKPIILKANHKDEPLNPLGIERRLSPPTVEFESMNRDYRVSTKDSSVSSNLMTKVTSNLKPVALNVNRKDKPLIPLGIERPLSPPSIEFESTSHNYVLPTKDSSASNNLRTQVTSDLKPVALKVNHRDEPLIPLGIERQLSPPSIEFNSLAPSSRKSFVSYLRNVEPTAIRSTHTKNTMNPLVIEKKLPSAIADESFKTTHSRKPTVALSIHLPSGGSRKHEHRLAPIGIRKISDNFIPSVITETKSKPPFAVQYQNPLVLDNKSNQETEIIPLSLINSNYQESQVHVDVVADFSNQVKNIRSNYYSETPSSILSKEPSTKIYPIRHTHIQLPAVVGGKGSSGCVSNNECNQQEVCQRGECILGCSVVKHLCIGKATCKTKHHVPACICPANYSARTFKKGPTTVQFGCLPLSMTRSSSSIVEIRTPSRFSSVSSSIVPTACTAENCTVIEHQRPIVAAPLRDDDYFPLRNVGGVSLPSSGSPCSPNPCGPNTRCDVNNNGIALCRCIDDYVPDEHTIKGCKPQCVSDSECPDDYHCRGQKCRRVCVAGSCGSLANCDGRNHRAVCTCPTGYGGNPSTSCQRIVPEIRVPEPLDIDPCTPNPCGSNADCRARGERPVCSCPRGYEGNPLTSCVRGECIDNSDCPSHRVCQGLKCIDPCIGICGHSAECTVRNHQPICSCPQSYMGDPLTSCRRITEYDVCNPTPCGSNTNCRAKTDNQGDLRAVCSCYDNYIGSPLTGCRPECTTDNECNQNQHCRNNRCINPCVDGCGDGAYCDVRNHRAVCRCPEFFKGDPHSRCYPECTAHEDCPGYQACIQFQCADPCVGACGTYSDCETREHTPICSCPKSMTGDPYIRCRKFTLEDLCRDNPCGNNADCTPGKDRSGNDRPVCTCPVGYIGNALVSCERGECERHEQCPDTEACYAYTCQSPCYTHLGSVCGENAQCEVKNHKPVCSCPRGYTGDPLSACRISPSARIAGRSYRKQ